MALETNFNFLTAKTFDFFVSLSEYNALRLENT